MRITLLRLSAPVLATLLLASLPADEAAAQSMIRPNTPAPRAVTAAPALPGLAGRQTPAPIDADPTANLSPNAALFDAVARGDTAAARDAVGRGADLRARNALGLTALDAAVDQGRNEIAFFLLSARELSPVGEGPPPAAALLTRPSPPRPMARPPALAPVASAAPRTARLWAGDGGAPRPDVGFLGFDAGRPAGAVPPDPRRATRG
jgi:hypothetical protein